jgi:diketogulonate reductase-like aldo/keto reductase
VKIPVLGLGVYQASSGTETYTAVRDALAAGYRHIDTAKIYGNERDVGKAIADSGIARADIFVTTKLWNSDHGYDKALAAFDKSLERLGLAYLDLYLVHWPVEGARLDSWRALEKLLADGRTRAIGVSNYMPQHLTELLAASKVAPAVNQVEFSPFLYQKELLALCVKHGILLEAYSPLTRGEKLRDKRLVTIAGRYSKTTAQLLIRWALQHDLVVIPKSTRKERIVENASVFDFEISASDMKALDAMNEDLHTGWDPTGAA